MLRDGLGCFKPSSLEIHVYMHIRPFRQVAIVPAGAIAGFNTDGLKTLPIIGPTLSHNLGLITLKEREPTPAAIGISTLIRSVWSTGRN